MDAPPEKEDCHPFVAGHWAFMHNGDLGGFHRLRRHLLAQLSEAAFSTIEGQTDSEHLFALFLDEVGGTAAETDAAGIASALKRAMARALALSVQHGDGAPSYLNLAVTDGRAAVVTRFTTDDRYDGESLYWNTGRRYVCEGGLCRMVEPDREGASVLISSERLSEDPGWEPVRAGHMVLVHADRTAHTQRIDLPSHDG